MQNFHHNYIKNKNRDKVELLLTDTEQSYIYKLSLKCL